MKERALRAAAEQHECRKSSHKWRTRAFVDVAADRVQKPPKVQIAISSGPSNGLAYLYARPRVPPGAHIGRRRFFWRTVSSCFQPHAEQRELVTTAVAAVDNVVGGGRFGGDRIFSRLGLLCEH